MKKIFNYSLLAFTLGLASCDKGLKDLNVNKTSPTTVDPAFLLNSAILNCSQPTKTIIYDVGVVQQMVTPNGGVLAGANFNVDSRDVVQATQWGYYYQSAIKYSYDAKVRSKDLPRTNLYNMARIINAYTFMVLTDEYGSIPYTEGGAGYTDLNFFPKYDKQEDIYPLLIKEFTEAAAALSTSAPIESTDLLYGGNIAKWKKFAYSLLLRAGMRLSKVDPAKAQSTVQAALAGGVILDNADNAVIRHDANFLNPVGNMLNGTEAANLYLAKPFVDSLKLNDDPRLSAIAIRYKGAKANTDQTVARGTTAAADQVGMPIGYDNNTILTRLGTDGVASHYDYSQVDRRRMAKTIAPAFLVTAAQTQLLLAEARFKGWISTGSAAQYFSDGIKAHMDQLASYDANSAIASSARDAYIASHPLVGGRELEQINTQYWIASFLNGPEAFANFRRSGYPRLAPNTYPSGDVPAGGFIRRITYPTSEIAVNTTNINDAISTMGPDKLTTRVWWDK